MATDMLINSRQAVIKQVNIGTSIYSARKGKTGFLPTRKRDTTLADFRLIAVRKLRKVITQGTGVYSLVVELRIPTMPEDNVFAHRSVHHPSLLRHVG